MVAPLAGFFQSLVPVARPIKLSTVTGALSGKRVQVMLPMVVSKMACTGCGAVVAEAAGFVAAGFCVVLVAVCAIANPTRVRQRIAIRKLRMVPPNGNYAFG